jgi:hypothetical protein
MRASPTPEAPSEPSLLDVGASDEVDASVDVEASDDVETSFDGDASRAVDASFGSVVGEGSGSEAQAAIRKVET